MTDVRRTRRSHIDALFRDALEIEESRRAAFLGEACRGDRVLQDEVEELLRLAGDPSAPSDLPPLVGERLWRELAAELDPGSASRPIVGRWRLVEEIGRGGTGTVYLAERAEGAFEQRAALKLLRPGVDSDEIQRRFEQERRILAGLNHPHIARLLDGGTDALGRPYLVMEHVDGVRLDAFCEATGADIRRRLTLLLQVAAAVEYAHRNLVVHRDIKPSNILVTPDGQVKLLDFGIAKLLLPDAAREAPPATRTMVRLLTPEYASPEQVRGERITTASDVYQLGVVLYELLSGERPFAIRHLDPLEIARVICHEEPPPPSRAAARAARPAAAPNGRARPRALSGDLDTIVLKAIAREPERRYASVGELRDDLLRYLEGLPVRARQPTTLYRLARFSRRHRAGLAAGVLVVGLLAAYAATTTVHSRRVAAESAKTEQVKEILVSLLSAANPGGGRGSEPTTSDLLRAGAERIATELDGQPDVQAEMMTLLGQVYGTRGQYAASADLLEPALAIRRQRLGPAHPEVARSAHLLAEIRHIQGRLDEAEALLGEALDINRRVFGERSREAGLTLDHLGDLLHTRGDLVRAEAVLRRALEIRQAAGAEAATVERHLANVLRDRGAHGEAEARYRRSLADTEARLGPMDPISALTRSELAVLLAETNRPDEAESLLQRNLSIYQTLYPDGHAMEGTTRRNLGLVRLRQARAGEARVLLDAALAIYRRTLGEGSSLIPRAERYLAEALLMAGDSVAAAAVAEEAVGRLRALGLAEHPAAAEALDVLAIARATGEGQVASVEPRAQASIR